MPGFLKDGRFWFGVHAGYLLVTFVPQVSLKGKMSKGAS